ncbi:MAG: TolC family protein [Gemmatimonadales bacterium]|jgi:outer membrane protein TolC
MRTKQGGRFVAGGWLLAAAWLVGSAGPLRAQSTGGSPPVGADSATPPTLGELYAAAERNDARSRQAALDESALELRLKNLTTEWLPRFSLSGEARYQSDVPSFQPAGAPSGQFPTVPKENYDVAVGVEQTLYDGGATGGRKAVERARTAEAKAHLQTTLNQLRGEVDRAYFTALALAARAAETELLIEDLSARLADARARVAAEVALTGEPAALEAELLRARQRLAEYHADRRAALTVLANLTGVTLDPDEELALPDLDAEVGSAADAIGRRRHPAFAAFRATEARLGRQSDLAGRARLPRLAAFGEAGYGRPGLNQFGDSWDTYWLGGVKLEWSPWHWGRVRREQEQLDLRREAVQTEEEAFAAALERASADERADLERLRTAIGSDDEIVRLRALIERQAERQFEEGVLPAADYVDRRTDLAQARIARRLHQIELAEAQARYLTTLGVPVP